MFNLKHILTLWLEMLNLFMKMFQHLYMNSNKSCTNATNFGLDETWILKYSTGFY